MKMLSDYLERAQGLCFPDKTLKKSTANGLVQSTRTHMHNTYTEDNE